jgi:branched-subunit amino acid transport protein
MTTTVVLLAAAVATSALRTVLVTVVPAHRLPAAARRALGHLAPAALAALVATAVAGHRGPAALLHPGTVPVLTALAVAALVAWRTRRRPRPALPILAAVAVMIIWEVLS